MKYWLTIMIGGMMLGCPESPPSKHTPPIAPEMSKCVTLVDIGHDPPHWWAGIEKGGEYIRCYKFYKWKPTANDVCNMSPPSSGVAVQNAPDPEWIRHLLVEDTCVGGVVNMVFPKSLRSSLSSVSTMGLASPMHECRSLPNAGRWMHDC